MKYKSIAFLALSSFFWESCIKESSTKSEAFISNICGKNLEILPFANGRIVHEHIIYLNNLAKMQIANSTERGIVNQSGFNSDYFNSVDSLVVVFNKADSVTHYFQTMPDSADVNNYPYNSNRNLLNLYSYEYSFEDKSSSFRKALYIYTFTEADYEFAKD